MIILYYFLIISVIFGLYYIVDHRKINKYLGELIKKIKNKKLSNKIIKSQGAKNVVAASIGQILADKKVNDEYNIANDLLFRLKNIVAYEKVLKENIYSNSVEVKEVKSIQDLVNDAVNNVYFAKELKIGRCNLIIRNGRLYYCYEIGFEKNQKYYMEIDVTDNSYKFLESYYEFNNHMFLNDYSVKSQNYKYLICGDHDDNPNENLGKQAGKWLLKISDKK